MKWKSDPYWRKAMEIAMSLSAAHICVLVPEEFMNMRTSFYPVKQAKQLERLEDITAYIIPKSDVGLLPPRLLRGETFRRFHCVFANEVFIAYSCLTEDGGFMAEMEKHIPAFLEKRGEYLASVDEEERNNGSGAPETHLPYLLDTQRNRILQMMFPHKRYLMEQFEDLSDAPIILKRQVVKYCVSEVRVELSSYCNRNCSYCPVSVHDRKNKEDKISPQIWDRCMEDLADIDFDGQLLFCLFNEPLYDRQFLLQMLDCAADKLPHCYIKIVTNGDFLTGDYFSELTRHKFSELSISIHYEGQWDLDQQVRTIWKTLDRINVPKQGSLTEGNSRVIFYVDSACYNSANIKSFVLRSEDFNIHGMDRGGVLTNGVYRAENLDFCFMPFECINIAHDGLMVPCCNFCSDVPGMEQWACGTISKNKDIFSAYTSGQAAAFRRALFAPREEGEFTPGPCQKCSVAHWDDNEKLYHLDGGIRREIRDGWFPEAKI